MGTLVLSDPANGTTADAATIANNNAALKTLINGGLDNGNLAAGAAIALSKLASYPTDASKVPTGGGTWVGSMLKIADTTLGVDTASISFTSIPATFAHLMVVIYARSDQAAATSGLYVRYNNDSTSIYDRQVLSGSNATALSAAGTAQNAGLIGDCPANTALANRFGASILFVPNYANATNYKSHFSLSGSIDATAAATNFITEIVTSMYRSATAISRLDIATNGFTSNLKTGSRATLYGLGA